MMAHLEAYYHAVPVGTSNNWAVNIKILTRTMQSGHNGKFGMKKALKKVFKIKYFFWNLPLTLDP